MNNEIEVLITEDRDKAYLVFNFDEPIKIEITSDDQGNTKKMFYKILEKFVNNQDISFNFNKERDDLYSEVAEKRRSNYNLLHQHLKETNRLNLSLDGNTVPMVYPYWPDNSCLRSYLMKHKIYVANYWPNVKQWTIPDDFEWNIAHSMLPLPIDQRYGDAEMIALVNQIISL